MDKYSVFIFYLFFINILGLLSGVNSHLKLLLPKYKPILLPLLALLSLKIACIGHFVQMWTQ